LYFLAQAVKIDVNMFYLVLVYATASYSAWSWGKAIKLQKEITGGAKSR
jgi:hypothetical protein